LGLLNRQDLPVAASQHHAAMRQAMGKLDYPAVNAAALKLIDEAFKQKDITLIDLAHIELDVLYAKTADPLKRAVLRQARAAAQLMGSASWDAASIHSPPHLARSVLMGEINTAEDVLQHFQLSEQLLEPPELLKGRCHLTPQECLALSLYSGRQRGLGNTVFLTLNTVMRANLKEAKQKLGFLLNPLLSGMHKLPALVNESLRRGIVFGDGGAQGIAHAKTQYQVGQHVEFSAPSTGSRVAPYPGNVVFMMSSAPAATRLRDSSAFHCRAAVLEGNFLPGAQFTVTDCEELTVPKEWASEDQVIAESGRQWRHRVGRPALVVHLEEVRADITS
jgi:hypothetical protein